MTAGGTLSCEGFIDTRLGTSDGGDGNDYAHRHEHHPDQQQHHIQ